MSEQKAYQDDLGITHQGPILCKKDGFDMMDCATCSHVHATPRGSWNHLQQVGSIR